MTGYDQPGITNPENVDALTHQQIYDAFQTVSDQTAEVVTTWQQARDKWRESTSQLVQAVRTAVDGQWTGVAADTAVQALSDYGTRAGQLADLFEQTGQVVANTAAAALTAKAYVPKPVPVTADQTEDPTGYDGQSRAAQQAQDDARQVMQQRYVLPFLDQDARLPAFPAAMSLAGADSSSGPLDSLLSGSGWSLTGSATTAAASGIPVNGATGTGPVGSLLSGVPGVPVGTAADPEASSSLFGSQGTRPEPNHFGPVGSGLGTTPRPERPTGSHSGHDAPPPRPERPVGGEKPGPSHGEPAVTGEPEPVEHAVPEGSRPGPEQTSEPVAGPGPVVTQHDPGHGDSTGTAATNGSHTGTAGAVGADRAGTGSGTGGGSGGSGGTSGPSGQSPNPAAPAPHSSPQPLGAPAAPAVPPAAPVPASPGPLSSAPVPSPPLAPPVPAAPPSLPNTPLPPGPSAPMSPLAPGPGPAPAPGSGVPVPAPGSGPSAPVPNAPPSPQPGAPGSPPGKPGPPAPMPNPPAAPPVPHAPTPKVPGFVSPAVPPASPDLTPYTAAGAAAISGTAAAEIAQTADDSMHRMPRLRGYAGDRERYGLRFDKHRETGAEDDAGPAESIDAESAVAVDGPRHSATDSSEHGFDTGTSEHGFAASTDAHDSGPDTREHRPIADTSEHGSHVDTSEHASHVDTATFVDGSGIPTGTQSVSVVSNAPETGTFAPRSETASSTDGLITPQQARCDEHSAAGIPSGAAESPSATQAAARTDLTAPAAAASPSGTAASPSGAAASPSGAAASPSGRHAASDTGGIASPADEPSSGAAAARPGGDAATAEGEESHTHEPAPGSGGGQIRSGTIGFVPEDTVHARSTATAPDNYRNVPPVIGE